MNRRTSTRALVFALALLTSSLRLAATARSVAAHTPAPSPPAAPGPAPSPTPISTPEAVNRGVFSELWVVPIATHRFQGAGLSLGYERSWLAALYRFGFVQNDYAPFDVMSLQRTQRLFLDLEVDAQWRLTGFTVTGGGGVALLHDRRETATPTAAGWATSARLDDKIRPVVNLGIVGPLFQVDATFYLGSNPELRLALGIKLGRPVRRRTGS